MIHEFGHFTVAKLSGIQVNEFSIGMGPSIYQNKNGETKYSIRALPIGGYVAMEGEEEHSNNPRSFNNANILKRIAVVVAGATMNFILGFVAFTLIFAIIGYPSNKVDNIIEGSPAYQAGIKKGDIITEINGHRVSDLKDLNYIIQSSKANSVEIKVSRNNEIKIVNLKPKFSIENDRYLIGITTELEKSFIKSIEYGFSRTIEMVMAILSSLKMMITGSFKMEYLSGPVGVVQIIGSESSKGFLNFLQILGLISVNLGVFNLLPIPALDGGKLLFLIIEAIIGRPINEKVEQILTIFGISLLFSLMIYVTIFNDIGRLFK